MDIAVILLCRLSMQGEMLCFKTQMGTGKFKRIIDKFSSSGKRRKEALAEQRFALKDFKLVG